MTKKIETENHVKDLVRQWFDAHDAWHYAPIQNGLGVHGIPDRVACVPITITLDMRGKKFGLFVAVESKKPGRRGEQDRGLSRHQKLVLDSVNAAGGVGIVCDGYEDLGALSRKVYQMEFEF